MEQQKIEELKERNVKAWVADVKIDLPIPA